MIGLTPAAADHIQEKIRQRGQGIGVRIGVKPSGCSGLAYLLEFVDAAQQDDILVEDQGVSLYLDPRSLDFIRDTQLDFVVEGLNSGLVFNNPNIKAECGCGKSFTV
ncbi:MAG: iron-sulfur cluster assembly accessory protein [Gammaproteobacteria bacterium AqS3]|nr:iron-sulfur cluster assembly accessory protein [Gammaproteobacteria bacterium AqS3]